MKNMEFRNDRSFQPKPRRPKDAQIFCVGWRAFVNSVAGRQVNSTDCEGNPVASDFKDGDEIQIVSWRPRSRDGATYQVRRTADGSETWLTGDSLRQDRLAKV